MCICTCSCRYNNVRSVVKSPLPRFYLGVAWLIWMAFMMRVMVVDGGFDIVGVMMLNGW